MLPSSQPPTSTASSNAVSLNGLNKHATAPAAMRRGWSDLSPCAVMKTIGMAISAAIQFLLKIWSAHPGQSDVEDQAVRLVAGFGGEERFGRCERLNGKPDLLQQVGQRLADGVAVVDDRHQWTLVHHDGLSACAASRTLLGRRGTETGKVARVHNVLIVDQLECVCTAAHRFPLASVVYVNSLAIACASVLGHVH